MHPDDLPPGAPRLALSIEKVLTKLESADLAAKRALDHILAEDPNISPNLSDSILALRYIRSVCRESRRILEEVKKISLVHSATRNRPSSSEPRETASDRTSD